MNAAIDGMADEQIPPQPPAEGSGLTTVDRYYLEWVEYQQQRGAKPNGDDLSKYLGEKGVVGRNGRAAAASTLRRYLLPFRIYSVWTEHRVRSEQPSLRAVAEACASRESPSSTTSPSRRRPSQSMPQTSSAAGTPSSATTPLRNHAERMRRAQPTAITGQYPLLHQGRPACRHSALLPTRPSPS